MDARAVRRRPSGHRLDPLTDRKVFIRALARRDLVSQGKWLNQQADAETADRFARATNAAFARLAEQPGLGALSTARSPRLANTHRWRVPGFPNHLIFYRERHDGVSIVRVLHAARDWKRD